MALDMQGGLMQRFGVRPFLTDGGLETCMIHHHGIELPMFAAFPLVRSPSGRQALRRYFAGFLDVAEALGMGFVLDTVTWRASVAWGARMGWRAEDVDAVNREAVVFARDLAKERSGRIILNGVIGPQGDARRADHVLSEDEAEDYHGRQITVLAEAGVELVTAMTISSVGEAIGIARAARMAGLPVALSFTLETDGCLRDATTLAQAIEIADEATAGYPSWYGINCAHPEHFAARMMGDFAGRIGAIRANASRLSHAQLDAAEDLDEGDPLELSQDYVRLRQMAPGLRVLGGCCGTDLRHVAAIGQRFARRE